MALNKTDNGTYRCEATNHLGTSHAEYKLLVKGEWQTDYINMSFKANTVLAALLENICFAN